jgi:integrase
MLERYFKGWQNRRLSSLKLKDVALLHSQIGATAPYAANRLVALVRKMFKLAHGWGVYRGDNPVIGLER